MASSVRSRANGTKRKKVKEFGLTLAQSTLCKEHVWASLVEMCEALLVAKEAHGGGGYHFHIFLRLYHKRRVVELREDVLANLSGGDPSSMGPASLHLDTLRNGKHWIKYCTKEDTDPLYINIDEGLFHQSWKIYDFIRNNEIFDSLQPFCRQNPSLINIMRRQHQQYWDKVHSQRFEKQVIQSTFKPNYEITWVREVTDLLATPTPKHLYIFGPTGTGKTTLINNLLLIHKSHIQVPCSKSPFEWSQVDSSVKLIIAADAPPNYVTAHREMILKLCDNQLVSINEKCAPLKRVHFSGSLVIISNYPPEFSLDHAGDASTYDPALLRRFQIINADVNGFLEIKTDIWHVQEETDGPIVISSEEEEI